MVGWGGSSSVPGSAEKTSCLGLVRLDLCCGPSLSTENGSAPIPPDMEASEPSATTGALVDGKGKTSQLNWPGRVHVGPHVGSLAHLLPEKLRV